MIASADTSLDAFYLSDEDLLNSPSFQDGVDQVTEFSLRLYGCDLIVEACIYLRLRQAVAATAQVLFHRFYCKKSLRAFNVKRVAAASVFLAAKLEEDVKKYRDVVNTFHRLERRREGKSLGFVDQKHKEDLKAELLRIERHMLREFGFIAQVEHPHKLVLMFKDLLKLKENDLMQEAWNLVSDSLRTTLCVRFSTEIVACGCIYVAARNLKRPLPETPGPDGNSGPWWECFSVKEADIIEVARVLTALYTLPKPQYIHLGKALVGSTPTRQAQAQQQPGQGNSQGTVAPEAAGVSRSTTPLPDAADTEAAAAGGQRPAMFGGGSPVGVFGDAREGFLANATGPVPPAATGAHSSRIATTEAGSRGDGRGMERGHSRSRSRSRSPTRFMDGGRDRALERGAVAGDRAQEDAARMQRGSSDATGNRGC